MKMEIDKKELANLIEMQLKNFFGFSANIYKYLDEALSRLEYCLSKSANKYYWRNDEVFFSPFHSGQNAIFLYYIANTVYLHEDDKKLAELLYYLNKILNAVDWYYEIELPSYFDVEHPLTSVLGRADYSDGLVIYQGITVGGDMAIKHNYPRLGKNLIIYSNSSIIGDCKVGDNVIISNGTTVMNEDIPCDSIVFGTSPNLIIKSKDSHYLKNKLQLFFK